MASDGYSRMVALLKVVLPLSALALLSTLFLLSRSVDPEAQIPFADKEIQDRLRDQQITGPFYSGTTANGDQISFSAEKMTTPQADTGENEALDVLVEIDTPAGTRIDLRAERARFDIATDRAELAGGVRISTTSGFELNSELLVSELTALTLHSPGEVRGASPAGELRAGAMRLSSPEPGSAPQMVFTDGVRLIYTPQVTKE